MPPPGGNASFSLSPEDDGIAAAEYLLARNAQRVLVLTGSDDGMRRAVRRVPRRTGRTRRHGRRHVDIGGADAATLLPRLQAALQKAGAVDAVFLAMRASRGAHGGAAAGAGRSRRQAARRDLALLSGTGKPAEDSALDGIAYPTEPWTVRGVSGLPSAASVASRQDRARPAARLFAFGYDAWLLTAYLEKLALDRTARCRAPPACCASTASATSLRTPAWSTFSGGTPVPLADAAADARSIAARDGADDAAARGTCSTRAANSRAQRAYAVGELDLVMRDGDDASSSSKCATAPRRLRRRRGSVDGRKRRKLVHAAQVFLGARALANAPCRFDVVDADGDPATPTALDPRRVPPDD